MTSLKLCFHNDIRRVSSDILNDLTFPQLLGIVESAYAPANKCIFTYVDDENDTITISNDQDLAEAVRIAQEENRKTLRINVKLAHESGRPSSGGDAASTIMPPLFELLTEALGSKHASVAQKPGKEFIRPGQCKRRFRCAKSMGAQCQLARKDVHHFVTCDGCGISPIIGKRFKCAICPDFDFCEYCEGSKSHPDDHSFLLIRSANRCPAAIHVLPRQQDNECKSNDAAAEEEQHDPEHFLKRLAEGELTLKEAIASGPEVLKQMCEQGNSAALLQKLKSLGGGCRTMEGLKAHSQAAQPLSNEWEVSDLDRAIAASMESTASCPGAADDLLEAAAAETAAEAAAESKDAEDATSTANMACAAEAGAVFEATAEAAKVAAAAAKAAEAAAEKAATEKAAAEKAAAEKAAAEKAAAEKAAAEKAAAEKAAAEKAAEVEAAKLKWTAQLRVLSSMGFTEEAALIPLLNKHNGEMLSLIEELYD